ncbi:enoyl-CoA hydratase/isomerase family protein [Streptomyces sp. NPDC058320]|uniref:enoyl-CoA hydratase/isomerase family protein n=1 Tax=unclassified Streptomyces TaxID=2593676 RepID=UPI00363FA53D
MTSPYGHVDYQVADDVATLTLTRVGRRNAISMDLVEDLACRLEQAAADPAVRAVVLTGADRDFCVGADLAAPMDSRFLRLEDPDEDAARLLRGSRAITLLRTLGKPTVAAIRGGCAGAGLSLALACDLRYATDTAVLNTAFVAIGLSGDFGMAWLLNNAIGPARATELLLLPGKMTARDALTKGLLTDVYEEDRFDERIAEVAGRLARSAPLALAGAKENLRAATSQTIEEYLPDEAARIVHCAYSRDSVEARTAFVEKRTAEFTGS